MDLEPSQIWGALIIFFWIPALLTLPLTWHRSWKWKLYSLLIGVLTGWLGLVLVFIADKAPRSMFTRAPQEGGDRPTRD